MIAAIRYLDTLSNATPGGFSASASSWVDWTETRSLVTG
jgi:hypothetical protein